MSNNFYLVGKIRLSKKYIFLFQNFQKLPSSYNTVHVFSFYKDLERRKHILFCLPLLYTHGKGHYFDCFDMFAV